MGEAVDYASSPNELIRLLVSHAQTPRKIATTLSDQKKKVLEKWVGNIDGRSGERVRDAVIRIIHQAESVKAAL
jgi:membrane carboxypeptidase/penicillin-binding protein PbpC